MGLLAVIGGVIYGLLHLIWLRKFDHRDEDDLGVESPEAEKLTEPKFKDQGTYMSQERLSLMIKYNQIGSLTSLPRGSKVRRGWIIRNPKVNGAIIREATGWCHCM